MLLKLDILAHLIENFSTPYGLWSCSEEKLSIPSEAHDLPSSREKFPFSCQTFQSRNLFILRPILLKLHIWAVLFESFPRRTARRVAAKKSFSSHCLRGSELMLIRLSYCLIFGESLLFCLTSYCADIVWQISADQELSNDVRLMEQCRKNLHFYTVHTLRQPDREERGVFTRTEGCTVSSEVH